MLIKNDLSNGSLMDLFDAFCCIKKKENVCYTTSILSLHFSDRYTYINF